MTDTININDIGTDLQITVKEGTSVVDISTATTLQILLTAPSGAVKTKTATLINTGTDGQMRYTTVSGDIDEVGTWDYYGRVTYSASQVYTTIDPQQFTVTG